VSDLLCPFYQKSCILKNQANLPDFKNQHDCNAQIAKCSFFAKEKLKQVSTNSPVKIIIKQVSNVFLVKADAIIYPTNNILETEQMLKILSNHEIDKRNLQILNQGIQMGYPYSFEIPNSWKIKQKHFINAVIAGESRLVNEPDLKSCMKKSILLADKLKLESLLILPADFGTHDLSLTSLAQLSSIFLFCKQHEFENLKNIFICMTDEETEQCFIEYYNRIFKEKEGEITPDK
jgi:hypothetical protein